MNKMATRKKRIVTYRVDGDQAGQTEKNVWFNSCGESKMVNELLLVIRTVGSPPNIEIMGYERGVQPSDAAKILERLKSYITDKNANAFENLLKTDFIYPGVLASSRTDNDQSKGKWWDEATETYRVRPNVEALFADQKKLFIELVEALIEADDQELYKAFLRSLDNTDLADHDLFRWDEGQQQRAKEQLESLASYGKSLLKGATDGSLEAVKGNAATTLAENLTKKITEKSTKKTAEDDHKAKFENLKFRVEVYQDLHAHDAEFAKVRGLGWKRIFANLCSILLTAGIANGINYLLTGNSLFCNQTTTQQKVANVQEAIDTDPQMIVKRVQAALL